MTTHSAAIRTVSGMVKPGFEPVLDVFVENFEKRDEIGAACCAYVRGEKVVDLWGGVRNKETGDRWEQDTMVIVYSTTKGISALTMAHAHSRGLFDYDAPVATYWPEFAQEGKDAITVRQLFGHQAGLIAFEGMERKDLLMDLDRLAAAIAGKKPEWEPGTRQGYHAITLGYYQNELLRRVDPKRRTIARYFQEELAEPLGGLEFYIALPENIPDSRLARTENTGLGRAIFHVSLKFFLAAMNPNSNLRRALAGSNLPVENGVYARGLEMPSGSGVGTARGIAGAYAEFADGGRRLGIKEETLRFLSAPPVLPLLGTRDEVMTVDTRFSLGFARPDPSDPFGSPSSYGHPGFGGSFGYADPEYGIGYGYTCNRLDSYLLDPRDIALRKALYAALEARR